VCERAHHRRRGATAVRRGEEYGQRTPRSVAHSPRYLHRAEIGGRGIQRAPAARPDRYRLDLVGHAMDKTTAAKQWVYFFGAGSADGGSELRDLLGGKGANVAEMARLGIPVPPGFTLTTDVCNHFMRHNGIYPEGLKDAVSAGLERLESTA